jgi:putative glutamine amidotransferase
MNGARPLIGIPANARREGNSGIDARIERHWVSEQYIRAVVDGAGAVPVLLPALGEELATSPTVERLDGLLFTGDRSNVEPRHYDGPPARPDTLQDPRRDATTLPLIRRAVDEGIPLLAICRGHQEFNVALGGTLHQHVHEVPGMADHRAPLGQPTEVRYAHAHAVHLVPGGLLERLAGAPEAQVNSLHGQAIERVAPGLAIEATAGDGVVESVRVPDSRAFALGVQWHPEWFVADWGVGRDPFAQAIFAAFGVAARERARRRP